MAADSKNTRAQSRLEKAAREDDKVRVHYEVEARIIAEKTARLRALRLTKEAPTKSGVIVAHTDVMHGSVVLPGITGPVQFHVT